MLYVLPICDYIHLFIISKSLHHTYYNDELKNFQITLARESLAAPLSTWSQL